MQHSPRKTLFLVVSDHITDIQRARNWAHINNYDIQVYNSTQWSFGLENTQFRKQLKLEKTAHTNQAQNPLFPEQKEAQKPLLKVISTPMAAFQHSESTRIQDTNHSNLQKIHNKKIMSLESIEQMAIQNAIEQCHGNISAAAKALGVGRATIYRKIKPHHTIKKAA